MESAGQNLGERPEYSHQFEGKANLACRRLSARLPRFAACLRKRACSRSEFAPTLRRPALFTEIRNPRSDVLIVGHDVLG